VCSLAFIPLKHAALGRALATSLAMGIAVGAWAQQHVATAATAAALARNGQYDAAVAEAKQALLIHPKDPALWTIEGIAYSMESKDAEALAALHKALGLAPDFLQALQTEAQILSRRHDPQLVPVLTRILRINEHDNTAREMLAVEQARTGDCQAANNNFGKISDQLSTHPESLERYGVCLFAEKEYEQSSAVFQQVSALEPASADARYDLALAQTRAGHNKEATETLQPLLSSPDVDTALLASDIFEDLGDTPQAVTLMRRAIVLDPGRADSYVRFAELCMLHESYQAGIDMVSAGISRLPDSSALYVARGLLYGGMAQYDKAEADFRAAEELDPAHGAGAYGVGLVQAQSHHSAEALATTRAGLHDHPADAQLNFLLARILLEDGADPGSPEFAEATRAAETAVHSDPNLLSARDLLAKIEDMRGNTQAVIEQCREALRIDPTDQSALFRLMRAVGKSGDTASAQALARQVAEQHQHARAEEGQRLRYKIVGATSPDSQPTQEH
jgi:tetratricopeptide (TPR) repeat protein